MHFITKDRKLKKIAVFQISTFELGQNIRKKTKTRLYWRVCLSWLTMLNELRTTYFDAVNDAYTQIKILKNILNIPVATPKTKLYTLV